MNKNAFENQLREHLMKLTPVLINALMKAVIAKAVVVHIKK
jgi:hypothetical protein